MTQNRLYLPGDMLHTGICHARSRSEEPILCMIREDTIKLVAVSGMRLVVSWEARLPERAPANLVFLIPPMVAGLLGSEIIEDQVGVEFIPWGVEVVARLTDHLGAYEIRWRSDLASFPAPEAFGRIMTVPRDLMDVPYLALSDAVHQAVAKLIRMEAEEQINGTKLAILIDLDFGGLRVDGEEIVLAESRRFYFDPRLVIRALEFVKEPILRMSVTPLAGDLRAYLSLLSEQEGWTVHCSLLSIGKETQKLYPLPPGRNR